tara:strand:- start:329 stop:439 length:111 start_codon:yes stop_codon:yes gene_type:complete
LILKALTVGELGNLAEENLIAMSLPSNKAKNIEGIP